MKRMLAARGKTLPRTSLWRFTYSLINLTSSSSGKRFAFKPEPSSSSQNSHSHTFQMPVCVKGNHRAYHSTEKRRAAIVHLPRTGQCARAGSPRRPTSQRGGAVQAAGPASPERREKYQQEAKQRAKTRENHLQNYPKQTAEVRECRFFSKVMLANI